MATSYDRALTALYQAPLEAFVAERKRLSAELKATGDKDGAARVARLGRPPISAWVVNQLYWRERDDFDALFETAERLRGGDLDATAEHREATAKLRARATEILIDAGHGATDATLRRVTTTLSALAVAGGFDPDPPGALSADRDPPGFESLELGMPARPAKAAPKPAAKSDEAESARARKAAQADQARLEREREKKRAERQRLDGALRTAKSDADARAREVERLKSELGDAEERAESAKNAVNQLEERLAKLE